MEKQKNIKQNIPESQELKSKSPEIRIEGIENKLNEVEKLYNEVGQEKGIQTAVRGMSQYELDKMQEEAKKTRKENLIAGGVLLTVAFLSALASRYLFEGVTLHDLNYADNLRNIMQNSNLTALEALAPITHVEEIPAKVQQLDAICKIVLEGVVAVGIAGTIHLVREGINEVKKVKKLMGQKTQTA
ncbi:MAG: hypothetical protein WC603_00830 [Candidatus Paceibacterota bacterium]|jgi:hypothetical protein